MFKYYEVPSPLPTLARGLFTREIRNDSQEEGKASKTYQIVARGYDKFFCVGEVPWTMWSSLEAHTSAPYTLSPKLNGRIILIAALTPSKLVITSKRSIGSFYTREASHTEAGERWLRKHLENKGKTKADLARTLWRSNLTAVTELWDDSFDEFFLGCLVAPPERTGLHLHGLNVRSKEFKTLSTELVDAFADEWGFIKTPTIVLKSIQEVKDFTNTCAETGKWNGKAVEGFIVRTHVAELPTSNNGKGRDLTLPPYNPGSSLFFKVKFDEPYMMYRDWREITLTFLSSKDQMNPSSVPSIRMKRAETKVYVKWIIDEITKDRGSFNKFNKGKTVFATREKFLEFLKTEEGMEQLASMKNGNEKDATGSATDKFNKTIIVPVAVPGCGKTSVSVALAHIFGFSHSESDDVYSIKSLSFTRDHDVYDLLRKHDVVIADNNNHLKVHRQSLRDETSRFPPPTRILALNWSLDQPPAAIHRICSDRIQRRVDNHQTLPADSSSNSHDDLLWLFINTAEELTPSEVDNVVEMKLGESMEESVKRAVEGCVTVMGLEMPSDEKIQEGLEIAKNYIPVKKPKEKKPNVLSYALFPTVNLEELLDRAFANEDQPNKTFWSQLKSKHRISRRPHIKIVHGWDRDTQGDLWNRCIALQEMSTGIPPLFKGRLSHVLWDGRVMVITVEDFDVASTLSESNEGREFVSNLSDEVRSRLYILVGKKNTNVRLLEAMTMVQKWRSGKKLHKIKSIKLDDITVYGRIKSLMD